MSYTFSDKRLTSKQDFQRLFRFGKKLFFPELILVYCENGHDLPRLGFAIGKKAIKKAVHRNKIRRIIRESFRRQTALPAVDLVVIGRHYLGKSTPHKLQLHQRLELVWKKLNYVYARESFSCSKDTSIS